MLSYWKFNRKTTMKFFLIKPSGALNIFRTFTIQILINSTLYYGPLYIKYVLCIHFLMHYIKNTARTYMEKCVKCGRKKNLYTSFSPRIHIQICSNSVWIWIIKMLPFFFMCKKSNFIWKSFRRVFEVKKLGEVVNNPG